MCDYEWASVSERSCIHEHELSVLSLINTTAHVHTFAQRVRVESNVQFTVSNRAKYVSRVTVAHTRFCLSSLNVFASVAKTDRRQTSPH